MEKNNSSPDPLNPIIVPKCLVDQCVKIGKKVDKETKKRESVSYFNYELSGSKSKKVIYRMTGRMPEASAIAIAKVMAQELQCSIYVRVQSNGSRSDIRVINPLPKEKNV
ncbi:MAG: hypothetical protein V1807_01070 [Patescibacteria group bacterium]